MLSKVLLKSQSGYIGITIAVFLLFLAIFLYPYIRFGEKGNYCLVGDAPEEVKIVELPVVEDGGGYKNNPSEFTKFQLIRKNVYIKQRSDFPPGDFINPAGKGETDHTIDYGIVDGLRVLYPAYYGEMDFYRDFSTDYTTYDNRSDADKSYTSANDNDQLRFRYEKILLFLHLNPDGTSVFKDGAFLADVYQDVERLYRENKGYDTQEIFVCPPYYRASDIKVSVPSQFVSLDKKQLQLEYFLFKSPVKSISNHCKPAIYLYPEKKSLVNVRVFPKGELGFTDPVYDKEKGWTVEAFPDGNLFSMNHELIIHNYLYYESKIGDEYIKKPTQGWVVRYEDMESLYKNILPRLGLNQKESSDFIKYWTKVLPKSAFYFVGLIDKPQRDYLEALEVTPKPDTSIRFSLYFDPLDKPLEVDEPEINTPERRGFTLVDWGGLIKLNPGSGFTCSQ